MGVDGSGRSRPGGRLPRPDVLSFRRPGPAAKRSRRRLVRLLGPPHRPPPGVSRRLEGHRLRGVVRESGGDPLRASAPARPRPSSSHRPPGPQLGDDPDYDARLRSPVLALPGFAVRGMMRMAPEIAATHPGWIDRVKFAVPQTARVLAAPPSPRLMAAWVNEWRRMDFAALSRRITAPTLCHYRRSGTRSHRPCRKLARVPDADSRRSVRAVAAHRPSRRRASGRSVCENGP